MAYIGKTNWQNNEIVEASDLNRIEQGIENSVEKIAGKGLSTNDYTTAEKNKLAGIAEQATKNDTDANLLNRANHTGTQSADTITDGTTNKVFTAIEKTKLANIEDGANNYTHPPTHPASMITDLPTGKKVARFVVGTSTAGWTLDDCDYLCDGTNDQEEIIQALNALPATGGEVVILDGTYNIKASINIPKDNVSIRGNGNATMLKRMYNSTNTDSGPTAGGLITLNEKSGCKIQGLQIDGNKATYAAIYNYGIYLSSSSNNNTVTGTTCNNNGRGISLSSSSNNTVTGNTCNNSNYGISLLSHSSDNTVTGNTCNNNSDGIRLVLSSNNTVTGNTCNNNSDHGIYLLSSSNNNTVTGNTCNNGNYGIRLTSSSNNTVTGNTCNNNSDGIRLASSSNNNTVTGNTCIRGTGTPEDYTSSQYTIYLSGSGNSYNLISSNNCMGKAPVVGGGTGNTLVNNKFDAS